MRGRIPKPTQLRVIEGNPGKRPLPANEPKPQTGVPSCPKGLPPEAKKEFHRVSHELTLLGLLTRVDRAALTSYALAWNRLLEAEGHLSVEGSVITGRGGEAVKSPWHVIATQSMEAVRRFAQEFGLTPSSRTRLTVPEPKRKSLSEIA